MIVIRMGHPCDRIMTVKVIRTIDIIYPKRVTEARCWYRGSQIRSYRKADEKLRGEHSAHPSRSPDRAAAFKLSDVRLHGTWLVVARVAWDFWAHFLWCC